MSEPWCGVEEVIALRALDACVEAVEWVEDQDGSAYDMWRRCDRGDWLLWLAGRVSVDYQMVVRAACACARTALPHVPGGEHRPLAAIETAEAWADGRGTLASVRETAAAAYAAYADAANTSAASAAYAAYAAYAVAYAAAYAAYDAAASAASYAAYVAARGTTLATCARIVRRHIPWAAVRNALAEQGGGSDV